MTKTRMSRKRQNKGSGATLMSQIAKPLDLRLFRQLNTGIVIDR